MSVKKKLMDQILDLKKELMILRFQKSMQQLVNTSSMKLVRRKIAKLYTQLNCFVGSQ